MSECRSFPIACDCSCPRAIDAAARDGCRYRALVSTTEPVLRLFLLEAPSAAVAGLRLLLPELVSTPLGVEIPLRNHGPEEILALCLRCGITARATCIVDRPSSG